MTFIDKDTFNCIEEQKSRIKKYAPKLILTKQPFAFFDKFKDIYAQNQLYNTEIIVKTQLNLK